MPVRRTANTHRLCVTGDCCPLETAILCSEPWPGSLSPESSRGWQGLWLFLCLQPHLWLLFLPGARCPQPSLLFPDHSLPLLPPGPLHLLLALALGGSDSGDPCDTPEMPDPWSLCSAACQSTSSPPLPSLQCWQLGILHMPQPWTPPRVGGISKFCF